MVTLEDLLETDFLPVIEFMGDDRECFDSAIHLESRDGFESHKFSADKERIKRLKNNALAIFNRCNQYLQTGGL